MVFEYFELNVDQLYLSKKNINKCKSYFFEPPCPRFLICSRKGQMALWLCAVFLQWGVALTMQNGSKWRYQMEYNQDTLNIVWTIFGKHECMPIIYCNIKWHGIWRIHLGHHMTLYDIVPTVKGWLWYMNMFWQVQWGNTDPPRGISAAKSEDVWSASQSLQSFNPIWLQDTKDIQRWGVSEKNSFRIGSYNVL